MSEEGVNKTVANCEANNQEILHIRARDEQDAIRFAGEHKSQMGALASARNKYLAETGQLPPSEDTLSKQADEKAVRAIAAKKTQDANGTWAITKAAAAAYKPDKPFVAAARVTEAAARSPQGQQTRAQGKGQSAG